MNLYDYWKSLSEEEKKIFCVEAGLSYGYMEVHLIHGRKKPRMETIQALVDASKKQLTHESLFNFFLKETQIA